MRYAIVSDIHANWQAWSAVRDDIRNRAADTMVCLGDIVGYGPSPTRVFADVAAHCDNIVLGNHDAAAAGTLDLSSFNENARRSAEWTAAQFDRASLQQLGSAPLVLEGEDVLFVHAETPAPDDFGYVETEDDARACFEATDRRFIFIGHTHQPLVFALGPDGAITKTLAPFVQVEAGVRYLVNVGSVGDPGDGTDKASYCVFDTKAGEIHLRKVAFDVAAFRAEIARVPELAPPWFLQHNEGETARPVYDQAVAAGKVAGTKIRVPSSRARIQVKASALATHHGETLRAANEAAKAPPPRPRRSRTGLLVGLICVGAAGAMVAIHLSSGRRPAAAAGRVAATTAAPAAATPAAVAAAAPGVPQAALLPAFQAVASREETADGKNNIAVLAVDGNPETRWCSGDRLAGHWIQIDLGSALRLGGLNIIWESPDPVYGYKIEGSRNAREWTALAEGSGRSADRIAVSGSHAFLRITATKLPDQKYASIAEITLFDAEGRQIRTEPPALPAPAAAAAASEPATVATLGDALGKIGDAKDYVLVYDLDLGKLERAITYEADRATTAPRFDRVAYLIELKKNNEPARFLWVSMDAFTTDAKLLGVPTVASGSHFQQSVGNITVVSDKPGITTGERLGAGNIEFWPNNYNPKNAAKVPGASESAYDFGDNVADPKDGYGSMQVHNTAAKQTLFAVNHWSHGRNADLGIGNGTGKNPDWTFSNNAHYYEAGRLRVFVHPAP